MFSNELVGKKCGYLDVKVPSKVRGRGIKAWKAWKKRWVVIHGMTNLSTKCPVVTIDMYSHENREGHQLERSTIYLEKVESICRTRSKSHLYAFSIDAHETLLYLSGYSETDSQHWIAAFKHILCPIATVPALHSSVGQVFQATLIESLSCYTNKFSGTVGHIIALPSVVLLAGLNDGCILAEWPLTTIQQMSVVKQVAHQDDKNKILMLEISNVAKNAGIFHFFSDVAITIEATLFKNTSEWLTSVTTYGTLNKSKCEPPSHFRKNSEDVTGFQKKIGNNEPVLIKALSAENLRTSSFSYRPLPPKPTSDCENKKETFKMVKDKILRPPHVLNTQQDTTMKLSIMNKRKWSSDTSLIRHKVNGERRRASLSTLLPLQDKVVRIKTETEETIKAIGNIQTDKHFLQIAQLRPLSVYSSTSQQSRDSGVMLSVPGEEGFDSGIPQRRSEKTEAVEQQPTSDKDKSQKEDVKKRWSLEDNESVAYRHFSEFIQEPEQMALYKNQADRLSTSSDSTLYSEIDTFTEIRKDDDPLYEDLDKFRKNLHKLLGIPQNVGVDSIKENTEKTSSKVHQPPPLPPRRYKRGMTRKLSVPPTPVRRKDVMKYLGVDTDKFYGSLDKLPQIRTGQNQLESTRNGPTKRKDIYRYLGIPSMAASQPAGLNTMAAAEQTYDSPSSTRQVPNNKTASMRRSTRTYVRVPSLHGNINSGTVTETKPSKKSRISFLKRKSSTKDLFNHDRDARNISSSTYVSYDSCFVDDWASIGATTSPLCSTPQVSTQILTSSAFTETEPTAPVAESPQTDPIIEEKDFEEEEAQSDEEHYCVPSSFKTTIAIEPSKIPLYVNLADLQMEANIDYFKTAPIEENTFPSIDIEITKCLEEEKESDESDASRDSNYMDMSVLSSRRTSPVSSMLLVKQNESHDSDYKRHRNSEYMEMDFANLGATLTDSDTEDPSSSNTDPTVILESVIVCINELQAICKAQILPTLPDDNRYLDPEFHPLEVFEKPDKLIVTGNEEMETKAQSALQNEDGSEMKDDEVPFGIEKQHTKVRDIKRLTSEEISEMVNRMSFDEEAATMLRQRLSSYIDQLFAPSHNIEDDDDTANILPDTQVSTVEDEHSNYSIDEKSQSDSEITNNNVEN